MTTPYPDPDDETGACARPSTDDPAWQVDAPAWHAGPAAWHDDDAAWHADDPDNATTTWLYGDDDTLVRPAWDADTPVGAHRAGERTIRSHRRPEPGRRVAFRVALAGAISGTGLAVVFALSGAGAPPTQETAARAPITTGTSTGSPAPGQSPAAVPSTTTSSSTSGPAATGTGSTTGVLTDQVAQAGVAMAPAPAAAPAPATTAAPTTANPPATTTAPPPTTVAPTTVPPTTVSPTTEPTTPPPTTAAPTNVPAQTTQAADATGTAAVTAS